MIGVQTGAGLIGHADFDQIFGDWLGGCALLGEAGRELQSFFALDAAPTKPGAIWSSVAWREAWSRGFLQDLADDQARDLALRNIEDLAAGRADVVITGQQPGFLGGPLHSLYKAATAVVLAELRTVAGRATVPVFWCADDDDDLREALQPVAWDPARGVLLRHEMHGRRNLSTDRMIGDLCAAEIARGESDWLRELAGRNELAADLAEIWRDAVDAGQTWGRLQRRALLRMFRQGGLLVVHGNDPLLHDAAASFYKELWRDRTRVREAARNGASRLDVGGYTPAVTEPSIQRFLHRGKDGRRRPLSAEHSGRLPDATELRPGVVVRSCVQDWLFQPAGVVVGPGEAAYLKQLTPVYDALDVPRSPLLPRLFASAGPGGPGGFPALAHELADRRRRDTDAELAAAARRVASLPRTDLLAALHREGEVPADRLQAVADQTIDRWSRYLASVLQRELHRRDDIAGDGQPVWLRPEGRRQERALATCAAAALWGDTFIDAVVHACRRHVDAGLDGDWREFLLTVPGA